MGARQLDVDQVSLPHTPAIALQPAPSTLVVDLGAVTFTDSAGLNTLLARTEADRRGIAVRLARPSRSAARVLEITGVDRVFPVDADGAAPAYWRRVGCYSRRPRQTGWRSRPAGVSSRNSTSARSSGRTNRTSVPPPAPSSSPRPPPAWHLGPSTDSPPGRAATAPSCSPPAPVAQTDDQVRWRSRRRGRGRRKERRGIRSSYAFASGPPARCELPEQAADAGELQPARAATGDQLHDQLAVQSIRPQRRRPHSLHGLGRDGHVCHQVLLPRSGVTP